MASYRNARINDQMAQTVAALVRDIKDPRVSCYLLSITRVEVTPDLKYAKIFYSALPRKTNRRVNQPDTQTEEQIKQQEKEAEKSLQAGLLHATSYLRHRVAQTLNLRITPQLQFILDHSMAHGAHISTLLHQVADDIERFDQRAAEQETEQERLMQEAEQETKTAFSGDAQEDGENQSEEFI